MDGDRVVRLRRTIIGPEDEAEPTVLLRANEHVVGASAMATAVGIYLHVIIAEEPAEIGRPGGSDV